METLLDPELEFEPVDCQAKILIVDDDQDQVAILKHHLSRQGFEVVTAFDGQTGLELIRKELPNLILLDIELPDATGFDVCQKISDDPSTCQIPVIFVSGAEYDDVLRKARAAGCSYYMRKPYDPNALLIVIKQALNENLF